MFHVSVATASKVLIGFVQSDINCVSEKSGLFFSWSDAGMWYCDALTRGRVNLPGGPQGTNSLLELDLIQIYSKKTTKKKSTGLLKSSKLWHSPSQYKG